MAHVFTPRSDAGSDTNSICRCGETWAWDGHIDPADLPAAPAPASPAQSVDIGVHVIDGLEYVRYESHLQIVGRAVDRAVAAALAAQADRIAGELDAAAQVTGRAEA